MNEIHIKEQLISQFNKIKNVEIVPWVEGQIGLTVLKNYPEDSRFVPVKDKLGKHDSVALIQIGVIESQDEESIPLSVTISKASRYKFEHHKFNYSEENSPTRTSVEKSDASTQPIDLEEPDRYLFKIRDRKIYDKENKIFITAEELVHDIYKQHLDTLSNTVFRGKMYVRRKVAE